MKKIITGERIALSAITVFYLFMLIAARGSFWQRFEPVQLNTAILLLPVAFFGHSFYLNNLYKQNRNNILYGSMVFLGFILSYYLPQIISTITGSASGTFEHMWTIYIGGVSLSWIYITTKDWYQNAAKIKELERDRVEAELKFLRAKVDPHFLFNTLNSIYAISLEEKAEKTGNSLIQLSDLMRFTLHEASQLKIKLSKELGFLQNYIALQNLRLPHEQEVKFLLEQSSVSSSAVVPPLLLLPLVENVFKHSSPNGDSAATISIVIQEQSIILTTKNHYAASVSVPSASGSGLSTLKDRLELLYPGNYELTSGKFGGIYISTLKFPFES